MLNVGLIGPGGIADRKLAPALAAAQGVQLWSVLSRDLERARRFADRHGAVAPRPAFQDLSALLADPDLDAVLVATPDRLHAQAVLAAAGAGKHVLCEKPMATSAAEARAMVDACRAADVRLGVAYHLRWNAGHRLLRDRVEDGARGELRHVRAQWTFRSPDNANWRARDEVGRWWALGGVGTHCLDLVRWFLLPHAGEVVTSTAVVSHEVFGGPHDEIEDFARAVAEGRDPAVNGEEGARNVELLEQALPETRA